MRAVDILATWAEVQNTREMATQRLLIGLLMSRLNVTEFRLEAADLRRVVRECSIDGRLDSDGSMVFTRVPRVGAES